ncbi:MAG: WYL domain-containing protein, partial [Deltaproteobacteria bacterium]|nr:WYL domain-containing protein [Deltaproteobacteria bacterium]
MPEKINTHRSYGEKLISLFARLLFSGQYYSLNQLSAMLECSKPTVLRLVQDIRQAYGVNIEEEMRGKRKYFRINKPTHLNLVVTMTEMEMTLLRMCQAFAKHLLGRTQFEEAARALLKTRALMDKGQEAQGDCFASLKFGYIDYTPHQETIKKLIQAMDERKICQITYKRILGPGAKTFYIKPLKIFSHRTSIYLHAAIAREPGKKVKPAEYDPLLAIHRIKKLEISDRFFEFPKDYDFEK